MKAILAKQISLQEMFRLQPGYNFPNPVDYPSTGERHTVGEVYDFISLMKFCLDEELTELLEALGDGSRKIHKPWTKEYEYLRNRPFSIDLKVVEEAIDALCFMMNILLTVGVTPENVENEYQKVWDKNVSRIRAKLGEIG
jgi:hypothetical protein